MNLDVRFITRFQVRQFHQRGIKNDALRIANFADRLDHGVILCFASPICQAARELGEATNRRCESLNPP